MTITCFLKQITITILILSTPIASNAVPGNTIKTIISYGVASAIPVYATMKAVASYAIVPAPWIKLLTGKYVENSKIFFKYPQNEKRPYKGPVIVHFTGNADHFQNHEGPLEIINKETKQPVIAINYAKIATSSYALTKDSSRILHEELDRNEISPTRIAFIGHSLGAAVSNKVAVNIQKDFDLNNDEISIISFCSFDKIHKIAGIPKLVFYALGWRLNPEESYQTHVIQDKKDVFMGKSRRSAQKGKVIEITSKTNHHLDWEATSDGKSVPMLIADIINENNN